MAETKKAVKPAAKKAKQGVDTKQIVMIVLLCLVGVGVVYGLYVASGKEPTLNCSSSHGGLTSFGSCTTQ